MRCVLLALMFPTALSAATSEFCLEGSFDLGARYQGTRPASGETYPARWCVVTEDDSARVLFAASGRSNPDMEGRWTVAYLPPDTVRILNRGASPDIEFDGTDNLAEALSLRRLDPRRLRDELERDPDAVGPLEWSASERGLTFARSRAPMPLRGLVDVTWRWDWTEPDQPLASLSLDSDVVFLARGRWRDVPDAEAQSLWETAPDSETIAVVGSNWPARVDMRLVELADDVYVVTGVRTGFRHMVIDTAEGLVVADAPTGWLELHHIPPADLVPGLGISGLSEALVDFLREQLPGRPLFAVALTHFHDDHAGGARAFAAAGAALYAPRESAAFLAAALNRPDMPDDRLARKNARAEVTPVADALVLGDKPNRVRIVTMGANPHVDAMLGVWALDRGYFFVSDIHVPRSAATSPRAERAVTECWFAGWAVANLPPEVLVVNSHSDTASPVSRLAMYLESDLCKN